MEIDNIELGFNTKKILYGVYLKGETGKVTGILGRNGSGKTSLLQIIFGNLDPKYKTIRKNGVYQKERLYKSNNIAYLPQHQLLPKNIKLSKAFSFFNVDWSLFTDLFNSFQTYENAHADQLSSGELRVIETYLILNAKKAILLLDEPFSFVAPLYIEKFKKIIEERKKESLIVITDHFYRDIMEVSDFIYLLKNGYSKIIKSKRDLENEGYINMEQ